jgi:hypothetical protein
MNSDSIVIALYVAERFLLRMWEILERPDRFECIGRDELSLES